MRFRQLWVSKCILLDQEQKTKMKKGVVYDIAKIASKGGKARAAKLSADELSRIAKLAVAARERKRKEKHNA